MGPTLIIFYTINTVLAVLLLRNTNRVLFVDSLPSCLLDLVAYLISKLINEDK